MISYAHISKSNNFIQNKMHFVFNIQQIFNNIQGESVCTSFTGAAYGIKYFKLISKKNYQDSSIV